LLQPRARPIKLRKLAKKKMRGQDQNLPLKMPLLTKRNQVDQFLKIQISLQPKARAKPSSSHKNQFLLAKCPSLQ